MVWFFVSFLLLYGGCHAYLFQKIRGAFPLGTGGQVFLGLLFALFVFLPFLIRVTEQSGLETLAHLFAYLAYVWGGLILLFVAASLLVDGYHGILRLGTMVLRNDLAALRVSPRYGFLVPLAAAAAINAYGFLEAWNIRTERLVFRSDKIPATIGRIRIAQISDVHIGMMVGPRRLARMLERVRQANPDLVVSTGDLVDGQPDSLRESLPLLRDLRPRYGKYAVTGNHEYYAGLDAAIAFTQEGGFHVLRGEGVVVAEGLNLVGVDDRTGRQFAGGRFVSERAVLAGMPEGHFTILLKHRPEVDPEAVGRFDLQLSGHTHQGQIFPFSIFTRLFFAYHAGLHPLAAGAHLYVNRGTGFWGPPVRFLAPPEVTVIDLVSAVPAPKGSP